MARLAEAMEGAAELAAQADPGFSDGCPGAMTRIKRGVAEVRKQPAMLAEADRAAAPGAWEFLLRVASGQPAFAKQVWEAASALLGSPVWASALKQASGKQRLGVARAQARDSGLVAGLVAALLVTGAAAELGEVLPPEATAAADPTLCSVVLAALQALPVPQRDAALASEAGAALAERAAVAGGAGDAARRRVIGGGGPKTFSKRDDIPVFTCEGIHGSHQTMDIKRGV